MEFGFENEKKFFDLDGNMISNTPLTNPYNYDAFVVWKGDYCKEKACTVYSDRLRSWDAQKYDRCYQEAFGNTGNSFNLKNPEGINHFLNLYFEKKTKLTAILQECNRSSGFPYWIFVYEEP